MRSIVQRVLEATCGVNGSTVGSIDHGLLVFVGIGDGDGEDDVEHMVDSLIGLRVFDNDQGKMDLDVRDVEGGLLVIPQFTLYGNTTRGRRPSFHRAAPPDRAESLYDRLVGRLRGIYEPVESGRFGAHMDIRARHDGPVTLILDSRAD